MLTRYTDMCSPERRSHGNRFMIPYSW